MSHQVLQCLSLDPSARPTVGQVFDTLYQQLDALLTAPGQGNNVAFSCALDNYLSLSWMKQQENTL